MRSCSSVSGLIVRHAGGDRKNRLAAILDKSKDAGGALHRGLSVASGYTTRRLHVSSADNDTPRSLYSLLALGSGLLGLNENFYLPAALRVTDGRHARHTRATVNRTLRHAFISGIVSRSNSARHRQK